MSSSTSFNTAATQQTQQKPIIRNKDMLALRRYMTAKDSNPRDGLAQTTLLIDLTHSNLIQKHIEIRFDMKYDTIYDVKQKIHQKTGTPPHFQTLHLKCCGQTLYVLEATDSPTATVTDNKDNYKLGYFFNNDLLDNSDSENGNGYGSFEIYCIDINPLSGSSNGQYENVNLITKYKMSDADYDNRKGTLRDWSKQQKEQDANFTLARHARIHREKCEAKRQWKVTNDSENLPYNYVVDSTGKDLIKEFDDNDHVINNDDNDNNNNNDDNNISNNNDHEYDEISISHLIVGSRCQIQPGSRRGVVSYIGLVPELDTTTSLSPSYWVGITFDEPVGKTDGSVSTRSKGGGAGTSKSKSYFEALPKYGSFVRGKNVQVGDFPEIDDLDSDFESDSDSEDEL